MGIEIPGAVTWLVPIVVGSDWPEGDETALWRLRDAWTGAAGGVRTVGRDADDVALRVLGTMEGPAAEAFLQFWQQFVTGDEAAFEQLARLCEQLGDACDGAALEIEYAKLSIIAALIALAAEIVAATAAAFVTFGASEAAVPAAEVATQITVRMIVQKLITAIVREVAIQVGTDVAIQLFQMLEGHRTSWDWSKTGGAAVNGVAGGIASGAFGFIKVAPGGLAPTLGKDALKGAGESVTGTVIGAGLTGQSLSPGDLLHAATSGGFGGAVGGVKEHYGAEHAGSPADGAPDGGSSDGGSPGSASPDSGDTADPASGGPSIDPAPTVHNQPDRADGPANTTPAAAGPVAPIPTAHGGDAPTTSIQSAGPDAVAPPPTRAHHTPTDTPSVPRSGSVISTALDPPAAPPGTTDQPAGPSPGTGTDTPVDRPGRYNLPTMRGARPGFASKYQEILRSEGIDQTAHDQLRSSTADGLNTDQRAEVIHVRNQVHVEPGEIMAKVLHPDQARLYLSNATTDAHGRSFDAGTVGGFIARGRDVADLTTPGALRDGLALDDHGAGWTPIPDGAANAYQLRWQAPIGPHPDDGMQIAYGGRDETSAEEMNSLAGGSTDPIRGSDPFLGTGYTAGGVPEWVARAANIGGHAEIWQVEIGGKERLVGVYEDGTWRKADG